MNINYSVDKLHEKIMPIWLAYLFGNMSARLKLEYKGPLWASKK